MGLNAGDFYRLRTDSTNIGELWTNASEVRRKIQENTTGAEIIEKQLEHIERTGGYILDGTSNAFIETHIKGSMLSMEPALTPKQAERLQQTLSKLTDEVRTQVLLRTLSSHIEIEEDDE